MTRQHTAKPRQRFCRSTAQTKQKHGKDTAKTRHKQGRPRPRHCKKRARHSKGTEKHSSDIAIQTRQGKSWQRDGDHGHNTGQDTAKKQQRQGKNTAKTRHRLSTDAAKTQQHRKNRLNTDANQGAYRHHAHQGTLDKGPGKQSWSTVRLQCDRAAESPQIVVTTLL